MRQRDALPRRSKPTHGLLGPPIGRRRLSRGLPDRIKVHHSLDPIRKRVDPGVDIRKIAGLHQAEMPFRQHDLILARQRAEHRHADARERRRHHRGMTCTRDAIEDHTRDRYVVTIARTAERHGGGRRGLAADIKHQHHLPAQARRKIGAGAVAGLPGLRGAVEQTHHAFGDGEIGARHDFSGKACDQILAHGPTVEVEAGTAGGDRVESRIDVIRAAFEGLHGTAATS